MNKLLPVIAGVKINTDDEGRFNLNALHKASGLGANKAPAQWLRTKTSKDLISELENQTVHICIVSTEGRDGGTFAHELLAIEYAGWISPSFRLKVNQTFLDYKTGILKPVIDINNPTFLRETLLTYTEKVITLELKVEEMRPNVEAFDRNTLTLRTRIKRLVRKTICFSRSIELHEKVIGAFIEKYMSYSLESLPKISLKALYYLGLNTN